MFKRIILVLGILLIPACSSGIKADYQIISGPSEIPIYYLSSIFGESDNLKFHYSKIQEKFYFEHDSDGDIVSSHEVTVCKKEEDFKCLLSEFLNFSFPSNFSGQKTWEFQGFFFEIIDSFEVTQKGKIKKFFHINSFKSLSDPYFERFIYSPEAGLVLYTRVSPSERNNSKLNVNYPIFIFEKKYGYKDYPFLP